MKRYQHSRFPEKSKGHPRHWLDTDLCIDGAAIGHKDFMLRHDLTSHPLLTLAALAKLADKLPAGAIECLAARQNVVAPGIDPPRLPRPSRTLLEIAKNSSWIVLLNVEQVSAYRDLLDSILGEVRPALPDREGGIEMGEAFVFLSSPGSTTPVHFDPEHNFLLQISGLKQVCVGQHPDADNKRREIERYLDGGHRNMGELPRQTGEFTLLPGFGLYLPPWQPHWIINGSAVSIFLSITFRTQRSERFELASKFNSKLRRLGFSPTIAGDAPLVDGVKAALMKSKGWIQRGGKARRSSREYS